MGYETRERELLHGLPGKPRYIQVILADWFEAYENFVAVTVLLKELVAERGGRAQVGCRRR